MKAYIGEKLSSLQR